LIDCLQNDPSPVIRGTAGWALRKFGGRDAEEAVARALQTDQDVQVLQELTAIPN
ncbi:epoxyqueuosine reductase, partial [Listeria monocytogenes]|nr:epoxyqueuosine reductase [Listeria monocytogenes]